MRLYESFLESFRNMNETSIIQAGKYLGQIINVIFDITKREILLSY